MKLRYPLALIITCIMLLATAQNSIAQSQLDKQISIDLKKKSVKNALAAIEAGCNCSFSYNSALLPVDSLVTISVKKQSVRHTLQLIFGDRYQYKEVDKHIIITQPEREKWYTISGIVTDSMSGAGIPLASIIERQELASTLTDNNGRFRLRLKDKGKFQRAQITVSMGSFFRDTSFTLPVGYDDEVAITLIPTTYSLPGISVTPGMEKSWLGRYLLSSKLRQQSANLGKFFVDKPVQASFIPGIGTHGKLSGQVTNTVSFNILGGYGAGVNGVEIGGLFNIDKKDVKYTQVGGIFNLVNGGVTGVQVGGIINQVAHGVNGVQVSGITGLVQGDMRGVMVSGICGQAGGKMQGLQVAGIANLLTMTDTTEDREIDSTSGMYGMQVAGIANVVNSTSYGMQLAGISNISRKRVKGTQVSGIVNLAPRGIKGSQIAGIVNITTKMDGVQIGLINIADTVTGYSVGLLNIVKHGYHTLSASTNELANVNLSYRTGNRKLYSILELSANLVSGSELYAYGLGIGTERKLSKKFGFAAEFTAHDLYAGGQNDPILIRASTLLNWHITKRVALYAGPHISYIPYIDPYSEATYPQTAPPSAFHDFKTSHKMVTWLGWQVGLQFF